jgi:hypothetical protein
MLKHCKSLFAYSVTVDLKQMSDNIEIDEPMQM